MAETTTTVEPRSASEAKAPAARGVGETVTVACKLPSGLILRIFRQEEYQVPHPSGGFGRATRAVQVGAEYEVKGFSVDLGKLSAGNMPEHLIIGGYGLTPGIPRDFWEKWHADNKASHLVKNHLIFAQPSEAQARDAARERSAVRSGLEPLNPDSLPNDVRNIKTDNRGNDADNL